MLTFYRAKRIIANKIKDVFNNPQDKILDIGSGISPWYHPIVKGSITKFDSIEDKHHIDVTGRMENLPFDSESFDKIICINALYYSSNPQKTFSEISRVLKKNGKVLIVTPFMYPIHDAPHDKFRFTEYAFESLFAGTCSDIEITPVGGIFSIPLMLVRSLIKGTPLIFPKFLRKIVMIFLIILMLPIYALSQLLTALDFADNSRRWPTYYIVVAKKNSGFPSKHYLPGSNKAMDTIS